MRTRRAQFATLRQDSAPLLLLVFLLGAVLSPVLHLSVHRDDHSHGLGSGRSHAAAHRAGLPHEHSHGPADDTGEPDHGRGSSAHFGLALLQAPASTGRPSPCRRAGSPRRSVAEAATAPDTSAAAGSRPSRSFTKLALDGR
jgi:hypothetical protein